MAGEVAAGSNGESVSARKPAAHRSAHSHAAVNSVADRGSVDGARISAPPPLCADKDHRTDQYGGGAVARQVFLLVFC
jgi:hypothetical protein